MQKTTLGEPKGPVLRRCLVVGCGGSGAKTLAFMMDQLRGELHDRGIDGPLPSGWQFVVLDVPVTPDAPPSGIRSVTEQGGTYLGIGSQAATYAQVDRVVSRRFADQSALGEIATWAPANPSSVSAIVSIGAGQYRAVGRMLTLAKLGEMDGALESAWNRLQDPQAHSDMAKLSAFGGYEPGAEPLVFVVSSMAGGAGASMTLDVCRLLTGQHQLQSGLIGAVLLGADVFGSLEPGDRLGVRANSLGMLGEIVATQFGEAQELDTEAANAAGVSRSFTDMPFARMFPVSRDVGLSASRFGDGTPDSLYRGLARGLSGLMVSPSALADYVQYDLGNRQSPAYRRDLIGWGPASQNFAWGSFGYASLSMGRERYAEFSAQRLARGAVDRLFKGHVVDESASSDVELNRLVAQMWPRVAEEIGVFVPDRNDPRRTYGAWMAERLWTQEAVTTEAATIVQGISDTLARPDGLDGSRWLDHVGRQLSSATPDADARALERAQAWAWNYQQSLFESLKAMVGRALADFGVPYALQLLAHVDDALALMVKESGAARAGQSPAPLSVPETVRRAVATVRGLIRGGDNYTKPLRDELNGWTRRRLYEKAAFLAEDLWSDFRGAVIAPLREELESRATTLREARASSATQAGQSVYASEAYADWPAPAATEVDRRFDTATNEILLTTSDQYLTNFETHLAQDGTSEREAANRVVLGVWPTGDGVRPPGGLIDGGGWVPRTFVHDPNSRRPLTPQPATWAVHISPSDLLGRGRLYVAREGGAFGEFSRASLRSYIIDAPNESIQRNRRNEIVSKLQEARRLASPLATVDARVVDAVYGETVQYQYKFSEVPFRGDALESTLLDSLTNDKTLVDSTLTSFKQALSQNGTVRRIDIFGSYPNYAPVCFKSVLEPVRVEWSGLTASSRVGFWDNRRARQLPGSLPMTTQERRAIVAGWFVGLAVGKVKVPTIKRVGDPETVRVYDSGKHRWVDFPEPMLTPKARFRQPVDWLPAVMESYLLAVVSFGLGEPGEALLPYRVVRRLFDHGEFELAEASLRNAKFEFAEWLAAHPSPGESAITSVDGNASLDERAAALSEFLAVWRGRASRFVNSDGGLLSIDSREIASQTPMWRDLVPDTIWAIDALSELIPAALEEAALLEKKPEPPEQKSETLSSDVFDWGEM